MWYPPAVPSRSMATGAIDIVERAYDVQPSTADWFENLVDAAANLVEHDMGLMASRVTGTTPDSTPTMSQAHVCGPDDQLPMKFLRAQLEIGPARLSEMVLPRAGTTFTAGEEAERIPFQTEVLKRHIGCEDLLVLSALDPNICGVGLNFVSSTPFDLTDSERDLLMKVCIHITAGDRLRRGLAPSDPLHRGVTLEEIRSQEHIDAILDPKRFQVADAKGDAEDRDVRERIRAAAKAVDRARGQLRRTDPEEALAIWQGLVRGRWSLVDWFDTDGRRFLVAKPNEPDLGDPRGLTQRELQVATYVAKGESQKLVGYRFGLSSGYVSSLLKSAMRKLGARTHADLVGKMRLWD